MKKLNEFLEFGHDHKWSNELAETRGNQVLKKIFSDDEKRKIAVQIDKCDKAGCIESCDIYIYDSVIDATKLINKYEYETGCSVKVFEITNEGYCHLFYKTFDGVNYQRLAQAKLEKYSMFNARYLYDTQAVIYVKENNDDKEE